MSSGEDPWVQVAPFVNIPDTSVAELLAERGVLLTDIAALVYEIQDPPAGLTRAECLSNVKKVIGKREAQYAILTGIALDMMAERGILPEPINSVIRTDDPLFGIDEVLALAITNIYGAVGLLTFGYLDKRKPGVIGRLHQDDGRSVNTFLDDLVAGVAAAASARIAHQRGSAEKLAGLGYGEAEKTG